MPEQNPFHISFVLMQSFTLTGRKELKHFIGQLLIKEGKSGGQLTYIFGSDEEVRVVNRDYLNHDYYTDIVTFHLANEHSVFVDAEIYISIDRIRDNARQFKSTFKKELHRVIFHGALHLAGYKDKTPAEEALMRKMEDTYLAAYGLS